MPVHQREREREILIYFVRSYREALIPILESDYPLDVTGLDATGAQGKGPRRCTEGSGRLVAHLPAMSQGYHQEI